jgi:hypothetical protein
MSSLAVFLMVASGVLCLTGAIAAKRNRHRRRIGDGHGHDRLGLHRPVLPPVAWSGALLIVGLVMAVSLRHVIRRR